MKTLGRTVRVVAGIIGLLVVLIALAAGPRSTATEWAMILPLTALAFMASIFMITKD